MDRFGPDRTGYAPFQTVISPANVNQLTQHWTASVGALRFDESDPVVADGHVFVSGGNSSGLNLSAFDASGSTNCTGTAPKSCSPQWSDILSSGIGTLSSAPAVSGGAVWVGTASLPGGSVNAYNESTGALKVTGGLGTSSSPAVAGNTVYSNWNYPHNGAIYGGLEAMDATTGATTFGAFQGPIDPAGSELFGNFGAPAVANGTLYAVNSNTNPATLDAFDATGTTNCQPTPSNLTPMNGTLGLPTFCAPLWTATLSGSAETTTTDSPAVANGYVYVGDSSGTLSAFPAGGCGAATCSAAWTAKTNGAIETSPAVTGTTVFVGSDDGSLYAFPATGCGAATCQPLWTAQTGGAVKSSPSVAGNVVYAGSDDDNLYAFNASGCGATACNPLLKANVGAPVETSPAIANGQVFVTDTAGTLHAYGLPGASS